MYIYIHIIYKCMNIYTRIFGRASRGLDPFEILCLCIHIRIHVYRDV